MSNFFWKSGRDDAQKGKGPADTSKMNSQERESYVAGRSAGKK